MRFTTRTAQARIATIRLLTSDKSMTCREMAEAMGCNAQIIWRYVNYLRKDGALKITTTSYRNNSYISTGVYTPPLPHVKIDSDGEIDVEIKVVNDQKKKAAQITPYRHWLDVAFFGPAVSLGNSQGK
jgi:hypothetical protein